MLNRLRLLKNVCTASVEQASPVKNGIGPTMEIYGNFLKIVHSFWRADPVLGHKVPLSRSNFIDKGLQFDCSTCETPDIPIHADKKYILQYQFWVCQQIPPESSVFLPVLTLDREHFQLLSFLSEIFSWDHELNLSCLKLPTKPHTVKRLHIDCRVITAQWECSVLMTNEVCPHDILPG